MVCACHTRISEAEQVTKSSAYPTVRVRVRARARARARVGVRVRVRVRIRARVTARVADVIDLVVVAGRLELGHEVVVLG